MCRKISISLCYSGEEMVGVCSLKLELTEYLLQYGGHVGYAVHPALQNRGYGTEILAQTLCIARELGFHRLLCVCDEDKGPIRAFVRKHRAMHQKGRCAKHAQSQSGAGRRQSAAP